MMRTPRVVTNPALRALALAGAFVSASALAATPVFQQVGSTLVMSNANVRLEYNLTTSRTDFFWQNARKISGFYAGVTLSSGYVCGTNYTSRTWALVSSNQVVVSQTAAGRPVMKQYFMLDRDNSFLTRVELTGSNLSANWMGPLVMDTTGGVDLGVTNDNRALVVPFDNDGFVRYKARPMNTTDTSIEVGAFYDNQTRLGLVVGSITHDTWKTGISWSGANNRLNSLKVFGGVTNDLTRDVEAHGSVMGNTISSPTLFVGFGPDWRRTLEDYADANAAVVPRLPWTNAMPFGWNSWGVIQKDMSYAKALAVSDFIKTNLQNNGFTDSDGTVYVNLDSWHNLSASQQQSFTAYCHANGQKAGIYWGGPFAYWGSASAASNQFVPPNNLYRYAEILLRDRNGNFIENGSAYAIDPSHPGTLALIDHQIDLFIARGFDFIKLDFISHGAMEGVHYDPAITTGKQAYNLGMQRIVNRIAGRMFISASIAPIFPYQYAHSRRIACDAFFSIGHTEYTMNSVSYGWWMSGRLYEYCDPDHLVFTNATPVTTNENQSRLISGAVTGLFLNGDDLATSTDGQNLARWHLTNAAINAVARVGRTFAPVEGNTGFNATDLFTRRDGTNFHIAIFNYTANATNRTVDLARAGLSAGTYTATDLWSGTTTTVTGTLNVSLNAKQSKLFRLSGPRPAAWFKADALTGLTNNAKVAAWPDSSGHSNHATNATTAQQPAYITNALNGRPAVRFNAANSTWLAFHRPVQDDFTILCVFQSTQGLGTGTDFWSGAGLVNGEVGASTSDFGTALNASGQILAGVGNGGTAVSASGFNDGRPHLLTFKRTRATGEVALYVDGTLTAVVTGNTSSLTAPPRLVLGAQQPIRNFLSGDIAEVKVFAGALTDPERAMEENALLAKYAIGAPSISSLAISSLALSGANLLLGGVNEGAGTIYVLASSNLALPRAQWQTVATGSVSGSGSFNLVASNVVTPNLPQRFFMLSTSDHAMP